MSMLPPLPVEIQELLETECWHGNPMSDNLYNTRIMEVMRKFHRYKKLMSACGHDTQELAGALARTEAAIQELKHVNEWMTDRFKEDPFPFMKVAADGAKQGERVAEYAAQQEESNKEKYDGYEPEGAACPL
jgi:hypothetical protein